MNRANQAPRTNPPGFQRYAATLAVTTASESGIRSRHTYANEPKANRSASSNTALSRVGSGSQSGLATNTATSAASVTAWTFRRASTPQIPRIAMPTYSRSSTGSVQSEPLTASGNGL